MSCIADPVFPLWINIEKKLIFLIQSCDKSILLFNQTGSIWLDNFIWLCNKLLTLSEKSIWNKVIFFIGKKMG